MDITQLEIYLNNEKQINYINNHYLFRPSLVLISIFCLLNGNYLALCLIFLLFLCSLLTRFFRHFQRIVARDFLNRHECDINIYRY